MDNTPSIVLAKNSMNKISVYIPEKFEVSCGSMQDHYCKTAPFEQIIIEFQQNNVKGLNT